jgi:hypothetical protein
MNKIKIFTTVCVLLAMALSVSSAPNICDQGCELNGDCGPLVGNCGGDTPYCCHKSFWDDVCVPDGFGFNECGTGQGYCHVCDEGCSILPAGESCGLLAGECSDPTPYCCKIHILPNKCVEESYDFGCCGGLPSEWGFEEGAVLVADEIENTDPQCAGSEYLIRWEARNKNEKEFRDYSSICYEGDYTDKKLKLDVGESIGDLTCRSTEIPPYYDGPHTARVSWCTLSKEFEYGIRPEEKKWTYMVYMDGDNDLGRYCVKELNEMEIVGSTSDINIVLQIDLTEGKDWTTAKRFYVTKDPDYVDESRIYSTELEDIGEVDMADPNTLIDFVRWAKEEFPADRYALIMWDHGTGLGLMEDESSGNKMTIEQFGYALHRIEPVDMLGFDACLMQTVEMNAEVKGCCDVAVGSEEVMFSSSWPYKDPLSALAKNPYMTSKDLGREIVEDFIGQFPEDKRDLTISAVDQNKLEGLIDAVDNFASEMIDGLERSPEYVSSMYNARDDVEYYNIRDHIDLYHFAELIALYIDDPEIDSAASKVMSSIDNTVIEEGHGPGHENSHGLSIYLPETKKEYNSSYENKKFAMETKWDEYIKKYYDTAAVNIPENCCNEIDDDLDGYENGADSECSVDIDLISGENDICWWTEYEIDPFECDGYGNHEDYYSGWYRCPDGSSITEIELYREIRGGDFLYIYDANGNELYKAGYISPLTPPEEGSFSPYSVILGPYPTDKVRFRLTSTGQSCTKTQVIVESITCSGGLE